jgi:hypothetical protein
MTMNREVFLSILAMDAYQRGYAPGIKGVSGTRLGGASLITRESRGISNVGYLEWHSTGFFAQEYEWGGDTVISYRGTDFDAANGSRMETAFPPNGLS